MAQQILIIGLGQFGMSLARALSEKGVEVLAVDSQKYLVEEAAEFVTEAVILDASDESDLAHLKPSQRDIAICAIGEESKEASIICTALLRQMGAPYVISRASDAMHKRILELVGAHQVINPEEEFGRRFASRLFFRDVIADTPLGEDLQITEIRVPRMMAGKSLVELELPKRFGIMVVAIRRSEPAHLFQPYPLEKLQQTDTLVIASTEQAIASFMKGL